MGFSNIYKSFSSLQKQDSTTYRIDFGLLFNLPVLGKTTLPLKKEGTIPLLKLPSVRVAALTVQKLNLTGATLNLRLQLNNPNSLDLLLQKINYNFVVNGNSWLNGMSSSPQNLSSHGNSYLNIPVSLNFLQMGQTVYQMISGQQEINYDLSGDLNLGSSNELLQNMNLPFNRVGSITIQK
jgi:LEA14-like dessication related protein